MLQYSTHDADKQPSVLHQLLRSLQVLLQRLPC